MNEESQAAQDLSIPLEGEWCGTLQAGGQALRLVLKIVRDAGGRLSATIDSLDQGVLGIPLSSLEQGETHIKLELAGAVAAYEGKMNAEGSEIAGEWSQGTASLPLVFHRNIRKSDKEDPPKGLPAGLAGFEDEASFSVILNEAKLGTMESIWRSNGSFEAISRLTLAGQTAETTITIVPDPDGGWKEFVHQSAVGTRTSAREGTSIKRTFKGSTKELTTTFECPQGAVLYDDDAPALISQALRLYDQSQGGVQRLPLLVGGRPPVVLALELKDRTLRAMAGRDIEVSKYRYGIPGADLSVWADATGKVHLVEVPALNVVMVREGYEALRTEKSVDPLLSAPQYEFVIERGVRVPLRDGIELSMDIYRPVGVERAPAILTRTPYKKEMLELQGNFYARRGYIYAAQDCRGCFGSSGCWDPMVNEAKDGYDTVEWLAGRSYSNGKVGMIGGSYAGAVQWSAAALRPPHLVTIIPNVSPPDPFHNVPYEYGVFFLWASIWWADAVESRVGADISGAALARISEKKYTRLLRTLPVIDLDKVVLGKEIPCWRQWIRHSTDDSYWEPADFLDNLQAVNIPAFHQSGWFDGDGIGAKLNYLKMVSHGHPHQKLTLGPWGHTDVATRLIGDRDFGENAIIDLQRDYLRWFDHWLKGIDNGIDKEPLVSLFVMGANEWRQGMTYPLETTQFQKLYLTSGGHANTSGGDGKLTFEPPEASTPSDHYTYDPGAPTPDPRAYEESEEDESRERSAEERKKEKEEYHLRICEQRKDILVYDTDPLSNPLIFAGPLSAVLYASTSARDTDWFITISEIGAEGKILLLAQGKIRARFRKSVKAPELIQPHEVYEYALDLWHTAIRVTAGSRLRVEVASAAFPMFSRNLNTGGHNETETNFVVAHQTVYHDARYPSHVLLPIIPV
jgi:putative CocE/NonD family hydrolase